MSGDEKCCGNAMCSFRNGAKKGEGLWIHFLMKKRLGGINFFFYDHNYARC
jgi:hypothetical protein